MAAAVVRRVHQASLSASVRCEQRLLGLDDDVGSLCFQRAVLDLASFAFAAVYCISWLIAAGRRRLRCNPPAVGRRWLFFASSAYSLAVGIATIAFAQCREDDDCGDHYHHVQLKGLIWILISSSLLLHRFKHSVFLSIAWWAASSVLEWAYSLEIIWRDNTMQALDAASWPLYVLLLSSSCTLYGQVRGVASRNQEHSDPLLLPSPDSRTDFGKAGFFSKLTFSWLSKLLKLGHSRPLVESDIPHLDPQDQASQAYSSFDREWARRTLARSLFFVLLLCNAQELLLIGTYALLRTMAFSAAPVLLYFFVAYSYREEQDLLTAFLLISFLIAMKIAECFSMRHWFFESRRAGMRMRSALMAAIYQKQMKLSCKGRSRHSAGEIANYIAVDAYRLGEFPLWLQLAWCMPLQLLLGVAMLIWLAGISALVGLLPLVACGVLNLPLGKVLQRSQSEFMSAQDKRQRAMSEAFNNIKIIKLQSWEDKFKESIQSLRGLEMKWLKEAQVTKAIGSALFWMSPTIVSAVIFAGATMLQGATLDAGTVFTILAIMRVVSEPMKTLPEVLSVMIQAMVSMRRVGNFLSEEEITGEEGEEQEQPEMEEPFTSIAISEGVFSWDPDYPTATLKNINLKVKKGEKIAVCGPVGAGKSSFLCAILKEIPRLSGTVEAYGSIAYVAQVSWIQSGTVRDNILFGKPMNQAEYEKVIKCCALDKDLENFVHGDLTEIGQRGLNLSGGQKQRIQLARALYNDAEIYLLDDPFSAVDAHTAKTLFNDCVMSALEHKTVVLVTHQVEFLSKVDRIIVVEGGKITQEGSYHELLESGLAFDRLVEAHNSSIAMLNMQEHAEEVVLPVQLPKHKSELEISTANNPQFSQLTEEEQKEAGQLGIKPYTDYFSVSRGWFLLATMICAQFAFVTLQCLATYYLAVALQTGLIRNGRTIGVYFAMTAFSCVFAYARSLQGAHLGLQASRAFFSDFMDSVFKAPMLFFDSTPLGRIMTRVSSDLSTLDFDIPYNMTFVISGTIEVATTISIMVIVTPQVLVFALPVIVMTLYVQRYCISSARELVRINGMTKAPVMNYAAESILGVVTIKAFSMASRFIRTNLKLIDRDASLFFYTNATLEWVTLRVEVLQILIVISSAVLLISLPSGTIAPGFLGLCLSYALTLSTAQVYLTRFYSNLENSIISVERIKQFMQIPTEPEAIIEDHRPPPSWPSEGRIDLQELKVKYRENAPNVLKGITCTFAPGKKIGIVGRTGSGKTTLLSALFRLVDPSDGRILIDGIDICTIGLRDLRMKLSIIPQEPTLFRGTIRSNLDPLAVHSDEQIWEALEKCQLKKDVSALPALLDSPVSDDGENWSAGQRQLFCLGRVLLRRNKILVLDEATASVDSVTDAILQRVIKQEFADCTVITIAHRVPTVVDSDMVMVLSYGRLVEYDKPSVLMENRESAFSKLVAEYWSNHS